MKILVLLSPTAAMSPDKVMPIIPAETRHAWELYKTNVIREIYFRGDSQGAVLVLEAENAAEAEKIAGTLPLVKEGLASTQIIPLMPFGGWERLSGHH